jgi:hypothetical protein
LATTDLFTNSFSDNFRLARSKTLNALASGTYNLIRLPKFAFVTDVWVNLTTAYVAGTPVVTVGWSGNGQTAVPAGFIDNDVFLPHTAGLKRAQHSTLITFEGKYFSAGPGAITVTITTGSATTLGIFQVFASYSVIM